MSNSGFKVLDSDMHILEPPDLWQRFLDKKFRHLAPVGTTDHVRDLRLIGPAGRASPAARPHFSQEPETVQKPQRARLVAPGAARRHGRGRRRSGDSLSEP